MAQLGSFMHYSVGSMNIVVGFLNNAHSSPLPIHER